MVNTDLKNQKNKNKVVPYCRSHFKRWNFLPCSFTMSQRVFLASVCRQVCIPTTHLLVGYTFWSWHFFFLGGLMCCVTLRPLQLGWRHKCTIVLVFIVFQYKSLEMYIYTKGDVTTVEKPCKRILGKVSRTYVYTRKSLKINQSFCRMFLAKSLKLQSLYLQLQCCVLQFKKYSLYVFVLYLYLCSFDNV